jgi:zinc transporter ZupT
MIFFAVEELIPESQCEGKRTDFVTMTTLAGFRVMILDIALG